MGTENTDIEREEPAAQAVSSILDLPDDELLNLDFASLGAAATTPAAGTTEEPEDPENGDPEDPEDAGNAAGEGAGGTDEEAEGDDDEAARAKPDAKPESEEAGGSQENKPEEKPVESSDYKAIVDRLFAPFQANGREMKVESVEEAITLMQMGANYNKKMAGLKPNLKLLKLLENNGLLSEEKLSYLIDLDKKDPQAIAKLVKDSGIDPLDMDGNKESEYKPKTYTVDDREIELDDVLQRLQGTSTYTQLLDVVGNKWDGPSKQVITNNPQLLEVLNAHMANGIYDLIVKEVERERMFGRLNGMSDLEAYRAAGDAIEARKGFAHLFPQQAPANTQPAQVSQPAAQANKEAVRNKKRAASPTKAAVPASVPANFNPLGMSDEEFSKINPKFV